jgi:hypothetical protein
MPTITPLHSIPNRRDVEDDRRIETVVRRKTGCTMGKRILIILGHPEEGTAPGIRDGSRRPGPLEQAPQGQVGAPRGHDGHGGRA